MGARTYQPGTGTFTSRDTWAGAPTDPVTLNRYTYANANPLRYWDPTGHWATDPVPPAAATPAAVVLARSVLAAAMPVLAMAGRFVRHHWQALGFAAVMIAAAGALAVILNYRYSQVGVAPAPPEDPGLLEPTPGTEPAPCIGDGGAPGTIDPGGACIPIPGGVDPHPDPDVVPEVDPDPDGAGTAECIPPGGDVSVEDFDPTESPSSEVLRKNMKDEGMTTPPFRHAAHHIVAGDDARAEGARLLLAAACFGINDAVNGVFLRDNDDVAVGANHRNIHTDKYYAEVERRMRGATTRDASARP